MKRIIVSETGGALARNFEMSVRAAPEKYHIIGISSQPYDLALSLADEKYLVPGAQDPAFIPVLRKIIKKTHADFLHSQHDTVIKVLANHARNLPIIMCLPNKKTVNACIDKFESYKLWNTKGVPVAATMEIATLRDLHAAQKKFGDGFWIRLKEGGGGAGSLSVENLAFAKYWIDYHNGWGKFIASEKLSRQSVTWTSIWNHGDLVVAQGRKRLYWLFANRTLSGVTGVTGTGETVADTAVDELAERAIAAIDHAPHGIFSVDMTYDTSGKLRVTEINIGRFFTTIHFFTRAGVNMPYIFLKLAFGESIPPISKKINPIAPGLLWVRGMDTTPVLTDTRVIDGYKKTLAGMTEKL
jgi:hypothetical protein